MVLSVSSKVVVGTGICKGKLESEKLWCVRRGSSRHSAAGRLILALDVKIDSKNWTPGHQISMLERNSASEH